MFKYIGIRGHRGAGKNTISYLLGIAIDFYSRNNSWVDFDAVFKKAVERVMEDEDFLDESNFRSVFFEAFSDTPKIMLSQLIGIPSNYLYDDWLKDAVFVDMVDFSHKLAKDKIEASTLKQTLKPYSASTLKFMIDNEPNLLVNKQHVYITLRELITYFSKYVMQSTFGKNVWVKALEVNRWENERFYTGSGKTIYKIFTDCKFPTEISYIKNNKGLIVKVNRYDNQKNETDFSEELLNDDRFDFEIDLDGNLLSTNTIDTIKSITLKIING